MANEVPCPTTPAAPARTILTSHGGGLHACCCGGAGAPCPVCNQSTPEKPPRLPKGLEIVFIVQGKPRKPEGIIKVVKETRREALEAARDPLENGMVIVTVIADGRVALNAFRTCHS